MATGQFEASNARLPACCAGLLAGQRVVLVYVPERAVVGGIERHVRVVAPTGVGGPLNAGAVDDRSFAQSHLA